MQNVTENQKKNAICLSLDEFKEVVNTVMPHTYVYFEDGLWYEREQGYPEVSEAQLYSLLAVHFDVAEITSIHADDCDVVGVWVVYKNSPTSSSNTCSEFDCIYNKFGVCSIGSCPEMDAVDEVLRKEGIL